ncbi:MAG: sodium:solute symporter family transporter [Candidatus Zhuqueibacterota bacterium]
MSLIDYGIVGLYLVFTMFLGMMLQKKASAGIDSFFLGDRKIPWWALGASGMASNLDVSGTMINTAWIFAIGAAGMFIEIRGGITLIMAFLMIFMGKWNRRAQVMTMAEWMRFRFGTDKQGDLARFISAIASIIMTIAMITYFAVGSGKFIGEFLGIPAFLGLSSEFWASILMILLCVIYASASGLYGVVWTDVMQAVLIFVAIVYVSVLAFGKTIPDSFNVSIPLPNHEFQTIPMTKEAWTSMIPSWNLNFPQESLYSIYNFFIVAIVFYLIKVTIEGSGGTGGYMIQRYFAAKSDREAGLLSLFWTFLLSFRWMFIAAIAWLAVAYGQAHHTISDPEMVIPVVINESFHVGMKGLLVTGLMAAAMSTFAPTVNAGAAYWVKDIYQAFIKPRASEKELLFQSRLSSVLIVILGLAFSVVIKNINDIWGWITMSIGAGMIVPLLVRWYWWRLNGYGFSIGMAAGMVAAIIQRLFFPHVPEYVAFSFATVVSLIAMIIGTFLTKPTDDVVLSEFYKITRPFGWWSRIRNKFPQYLIKEVNKENRRDIFSTIIAVPWQLSLFMIWMLFIMRRWDQFTYLLIALVVMSVILYFSWFRHLSTEVKITGEK